MKYKVLQNFTIRREPRIVEYKLDNAWITNAVGTEAKGDIVDVLDLVTDKSGMTRGRISLDDPSGKTNWICISTTNTTFAELADSEKPAPATLSLQEWIEAVDFWARTHGYTGMRTPIG